MGFIFPEFHAKKIQKITLETPFSTDKSCSDFYLSDAIL